MPRGIVMKRLAVLSFVGFVCVMSAPAPAHASIWRYIDELRGPGPFFGATLQFRARWWKNEDLYPGAKPSSPPSKDEGNLGFKSLGAPLVGLKTQCLSNAKIGTYPRISLNLESGYLQAKAANNPIRYD